MSTAAQHTPVSASYLERSLNVATAIAVLFMLFAGVRWLTADASTPEPLVGTEVPLKGIDWAANGRTLLIAVQRDCPYCESSMPFYQDVVASSESGGFRPVLLVPHKPIIGREFASEFDLPVTDIRTVDFESLQIPGTPALLLVNDKGVLTNAWVGRLTPQGEAAVFRALNTQRQSATGEPPDPKPSTVAFLSWHGSAAVVDTRSRDQFDRAHIDASRNIPHDELMSRIPSELPADSRVFLYCDQEPECLFYMAPVEGESLCDVAKAAFALLGFTNVTVLDDSLANLAATGIVVRGRDLALAGVRGNASLEN